MRHAAEAITALDVFLGDVRVGSLVRTPGDFNAFSLDPAYRAGGGVPVLSLSLRAAAGGLRKDPRPIAGSLPPFFANLLPEDKLRAAMEAHHAGHVRAGNDFDLLAALGADLPGAVRVLPAAGQPDAGRAVADVRPKTRFSLAGVQMKLSVMKNTGKGGGLTVPLGDGQGRYIAKFPSTAFVGVSENEFANLALAEAIGMEVPARELVGRAQFEGVPPEFEAMTDGLVLLVQRFDRAGDGVRVHMEDFAQVFGLYPARKYDGAASHDIAAVLGGAVSIAAGLEFVRRLALSVVMGNGDMHLKNWSLIYRGRGDAPGLAPVYDMLSTVPYIPADGLALSLGGTHSFRAVTAARWAAFANRARLPAPAVMRAVHDVVRQVDALWWTLPERAVVPPQVLARIDAHVRAMVPVMLG